MKTRITYSLAAILAATFVVGLTYQESLQDQDEIFLADFAITVEADQSQIKLTCSSGCAWTELSWSADALRPIGVNQFGMTSSAEDK